MIKKYFKKYRGLMGVLFLYAVLGVVWPEKMPDVLGETQNFLVQVALIFPVVLVLMGLFEVWVPKSMIQKHMGIGSGTRGVILAFLFGTAPTGPLYVAFPIAMSLLKKGARVSNIVVFLSAWASVKAPQVMVEVQFLGPDFAAVRLILTIAAIVIIGYITELFVKMEDIQPVQERSNQTFQE